MSTETTNTTVTEFEDGSKIVETTTTESDYIPSDTSEHPEVSEGVLEPVTEAAVQIAEIEANKEIILAEIHAETRLAETEAYSNSMEKDQWQQNIETKLEALTNSLEQVTATLSTLSQLEQAEANQSETANPGGASVEAMPVNPEAEPEQSAPEPQKRARKSRWI